MNPKFIIAAALIGGITIGFVWWRAHAHSPKKVTNGIVIFDNSDSTGDEPMVLVGLAERALNRPKLTSGSILMVISLGDLRTQNEPRMIARYDVPFSRRSLEGKGSLSRRRGEILTDLRNRVGDLQRTGQSPIFLAIKRGVEQLRGSGCMADSECYLFVRTDGEETAELGLKKTIAGGNKSQTPNLIANEGITVVFCGLAEAKEATGEENNRRRVHNAQRGDRIRETWLSVFTASESVSFEPYCPKSEADKMVED